PRRQCPLGQSATDTVATNPRSAVSHRPLRQQRAATLSAACPPAMKPRWESASSFARGGLPGDRLRDGGARAAAIMALPAAVATRRVPAFAAMWAEITIRAGA